MKKQIIAAIAAVVLLSTLLSFTVKWLMPHPAANAAQNADGLLIFHYAMPAATYQVIGSVKLSGIVSSERADRCIESLCKRAKKEFPSCEAIVLNSECSRAECIRFND